MQSSIKKVLVVGPTWIGDMVMTQSLFKVIKTQHSDAQIDVLAPAWSKDILGFMPEVSEVIISPFKHGEFQLRQRYQLAREIRKHSYDQAILIPNSWKSALVPFFAGIPLRTGWLGEMRYGLLNDFRKLDKRKYPKFVQRFAALGLSKKQSLNSFSPPAFTVSETEVQKTLEKFDLNLETPILLVCPGAEKGPAKIWPPNYFSEVINTKIQAGWQVWLLGSPKDVEVGLEIEKQSDKLINLIGKTSLKEAVLLISAVQKVLTNDSGLMHIAGAFNKSLIVIYGSTSPQNSPPLNELNKCIYLALPCSPCNERVCPLQHFKCMVDIKPGQVLDALD